MFKLHDAVQIEMDGGSVFMPVEHRETDGEGHPRYFVNLKVEHKLQRCMQTPQYDRPFSKTSIIEKLRSLQDAAAYDTAGMKKPSSKRRYTKKEKASMTLVENESAVIHAPAVGSIAAWSIPIKLTAPKDKKIIIEFSIKLLMYLREAIIVEFEKPIQVERKKRTATDMELRHRMVCL